MLLLMSKKGTLSNEYLDVFIPFVCFKNAWNTWIKTGTFSCPGVWMSFSVTLPPVELFLCISLIRANKEPHPTMPPSARHYAYIYQKRLPLITVFVISSGCRIGSTEHSNHVMGTVGTLPRTPFIVSNKHSYIERTTSTNGRKTVSVHISSSPRRQSK